MDANDLLAKYAEAISRNESGGNYNALGPVTMHGRAYGKYQVMAENVGPWSAEALGKSLTPEQFLADPKAQDAVFNNKFGSYLQKTGSPQDAASMWFTGRPLAQGANAQDVSGTTGQDYVNKFNSSLDAPPISQSNSMSVNQAPQQLLPQTPIAPLPQGGKKTQAYADLLLKQASSGTPVYSTGEGIARLLGGALSGFESNQADSMDKERSSALAQLLQGQGISSPLLGALDSEGLNKVAESSLVEQLKPKEPIKLSPGEQLVDPKTFKPVASGPPKQKEPFSLNPGENRYDENGNLVVSGPNKQLSDAQNNDMGFYKRGTGALNNLDKTDAALTEKRGYLDMIPIVGNEFTSNNYKLAKQAGSEFMAAILRSDSSRITDSVLKQYGRAYIPEPGDDQNVLGQKREARHRALDALKSGLPSDAILAQTGMPQQPQQEPTQNGGFKILNIR